MARAAVFPDKDHAEADGNQGQRRSSDIEGHNLGRDSRPDIGANNHAHRLNQGHETGAHEAHHQNRRNR